jgi:hypothetical protein
MAFKPFLDVPNFEQVRLTFVYRHNPHSHGNFQYPEMQLLFVLLSPLQFSLPLVAYVVGIFSFYLQIKQQLNFM